MLLYKKLLLMTFGTNLVYYTEGVTNGALQDIHKPRNKKTY